MEGRDSGFRSIVLNIFNRWSGLKMMVDHQMGGRLSGDKALYLVQYVTDIFATNQSVEAEDLEDTLIEFMDQECNTVLEDESPMEVARALVRLYSVYNAGGLVAAETEIKTLPPVTEWIDVIPESRPRRQIIDSQLEDSNSSEGEEGTNEMEQDSEWTEVKYGRKR